MLTEEYIVMNLDGQEAYVRKDSLKRLGRVDAVVFDCDGVLIDIRGSYNRAISNVSAYIFEGLAGYAFPEDLVSDEIIFLFRKSGGFNNDWDSVYGILMFALSSLPASIRGRLREHMEQIGWRLGPFERFSLMEKAAKRELEAGILNNEFFRGLISNLKEFADKLDATGADSVDRNLLGAPGAAGDFLDFYNTLKRFLHYPAQVGKSILATAFEEFFCGSELFQETYGVEPTFNSGKGMIENEELIVRPQALDHLTSIFGKANLGIASGSRLKPAKQVLRGLLEHFNPDSLVFLETMEENERLQLKEKGKEVNLKKPHPFSLVKSAEGFGPFSSVVYVGDSMEDVIMAQEARNLDERFLSGGVYCYSGLEDIVLSRFLEAGCDVVIPSVNELPMLLEKLRREKL